MNDQKPRRLKALAAVINASRKFKAEIIEGYCNTDSKPRGFRYITHKGKGRHGNRLLVFDLSGKKVLDHNAAETYRCNAEVEDWVRRNVRAKR